VGGREEGCARARTCVRESVREICCMCSQACMKDEWVRGLQVECKSVCVSMCACIHIQMWILTYIYISFLMNNSYPKIDKHLILTCILVFILVLTWTPFCILSWTMNFYQHSGTQTWNPT